ncbi:tRNA pseudouridine(13) synthase TruD [Pseudomaricurvus alkylphenolicus]|jgi:tRNA pseudouridine13 synthase|uniref:tRNA pseudouridine(13) synthase TruD n=1 Tax=Pseudomaricurvus alkylphenolicus TaxID=1306991 RepID=UPI00142164DF|nr:tRNA pseudouridine(13) synthase TruD [Pseudomaricurvus alkylphenolicus]NIB39699.1 tRNA pseudouridine(13) synthase TruD [Pseudomaricurvus alkylphenolicus]
MTQFPLNWAYAQGAPEVTGLFRAQPEDFQVDEDLGIELTGEGEHVYLHIRKRGDNTAWVAKQIARLADVNTGDVGYAGLKDRNAVTTQWFSVYLPKGEEPDWASLNSESIKVLAVTRHRQKLRRGTHRANLFAIRLRQLQGDDSGLQPRLERVAQQGVPNYFGEQRFGHDGGNLELAQRLLVDGDKIRNRQRRGLTMSAARSYLFNRVLSERVRRGDWLSQLPGEVAINDAPSGPLWGRGRLATSDECQQLELDILQPLQAWCNGLEHVGLTQERRALQLIPEALQWQRQAEDLKLQFSLPPGTYATAVLREICQLKQMSAPEDMV